MDFEHRGWPPQPPTEIVPNLTTESIILANVFFLFEEEKIFIKLQLILMLMRRKKS